MSWIQGLPGSEAVEERAEKAWRMPVGAVSPLWVVFGAAAGVGVAYWWLTQLSRAAVNLEALSGAATPKPAPKPTPTPKLALVPAVSAPEVVEATVEAVTPKPIVEAKPIAEPAPIVAPAPAAAPEVPAPVSADDLTRMTGIGPKLSLALADRGVTRFAQIAAWTADDLAAFDSALALKGRAVREAWVAQAKRLAKET